MSVNHSDPPQSMSQQKIYTRCEDSVAGPGSRPSCPGTQSEHSGATSIVRYRRIPRPVMSSFRYSHEITSVQRLMLHCLRIPRACFRTANMLLWVQNMVPRPRFQWHTETKEPSPILHLSLGHAKPVHEWKSIQLHNRFHPSHRGGTPDTVIYDASFSQNAGFAVGKKRKEAY